MKPRFKTYYWTTDAVSGYIEARSPRDVLDRLIAENEWPEIGSPRERRLLDERRDARRYVGPWPVVAHPPCERWGRY
jgi:hypothetical protein